jgi:hypothetical protein
MPIALDRSPEEQAVDDAFEACARKHGPAVAAKAAAAWLLGYVQAVKSEQTVIAFDGEGLVTIANFRANDH